MNTFNYLPFSNFESTYFILITVLLLKNVVISICVPGRNLNTPPNCKNKLLFINTHYPKIPRSQKFSLNSGWGLTDKYSWKETNEYIYISSSLGPNIDSSHIKVNLTKDFIKVDKQGSIIPLFEGKTKVCAQFHIYFKGKIEVDESFWTLEEQKGTSELQITLKKSQQFQQEWFGVLVNENVQLKDYYGNSDSMQILKPGR
ncbi:uncharacterized protein TOT_030000528 [Theileria orientalis strain Shintoku]|uniref:NudC domain-containing protein 1 n=1 Tax=Theileria orientalis strain Shintoku TaxID=869250 RepID=J4D994_THEOR|nr:uncharacterized protein TOT_030000528 [Theileria orientalis strain Shintoku]PVC49723.1 hypothetical protein MACL_00002758 [Theileria orientalis]BAM41265.1 uncharacterized protein TOT_030000528 [Theileria orientalis strain Shintoku]|eukprot:XP_009691566.1 uncharacterized protein TOT_030000528 [Theileria orientalis strain Shintoku]